MASMPVPLGVAVLASAMYWTGPFGAKQRDTSAQARRADWEAQLCCICLQIPVLQRQAMLPGKQSNESTPAAWIQACDGIMDSSMGV